MARVWSGKEIGRHVQGMTHAKTQVQEYAVDLTVKGVFKLTKPGNLDFGGSEYSPCEGDRILPRKRKPEDKYGWWELEAGDYLLEYNESIGLPEKCVGILQPHHRLVVAGAFHNDHLLIYPDVVPAALLHVGRIGLNIKENARVSQLIVLDVE